MEAIPGFEIAGLGAVRERTAERVHRVGFHTVTLVAAGTGEHAVDFVTYACRPGTLLWIRPGQVRRFGAGGALDGVHLMFTAEFPPAVAGVERAGLPSARYGAGVRGRPDTAGPAAGRVHAAGPGVAGDPPTPARRAAVAGEPAAGDRR